MRVKLKKLRITKLTPLKEVLELSKECKNCSLCCRYGSGFILKEELPRIAKFLNISQEKLKQNYLEEVELFNKKLFKPRTIKLDKPYGHCIFLGNNGCRIHEVKPLHCRISNCNEYGEDLNQWFLLNYIINPNDPESIRQWANFVKFNEVIPGGNLHELIKDKEILKKILNYEILK